MRCPKTDFAPRLTVFQTQPEIGWDVITAPIRLIGNQSVEQKLLCNVESTECHCAVDLSQVRRIDTAAVGLLVRLQKVLRARDRHLVLIAPGRHVRRALAFLSLEEVFHVAPDFPAARRLVEVLTNENRYPVMRQFVDETELWIWQGELTAASVERFMEVSRAFLASANQNEVVIDISRVRFIDCSGAGLLAEIQAMAEREGVRLQIVGITASIRNVLRHAGVNVSVPTGDSPRRDGVPVGKLVPPRPA
jgi:anti-anti-sigma factor